MKRHKYKDGQEVKVGGKLYLYVEDEGIEKGKGCLHASGGHLPGILCPFCLNDRFQIFYSNYEELSVKCLCGHNMLIMKK